MFKLQLPLSVLSGLFLAALGWGVGQAPIWGAAFTPQWIGIFWILGVMVTSILILILAIRASKINNEASTTQFSPIIDKLGELKSGLDSQHKALQDVIQTLSVTNKSANSPAPEIDFQPLLNKLDLLQPSVEVNLQPLVQKLSELQASIEAQQIHIHEQMEQTLQKVSPSSEINLNPLLEKLDSLQPSVEVNLQPLVQKLSELQASIEAQQIHVYEQMEQTLQKVSPSSEINLNPLLERLDSLQPEVKVDFAPLLEKLQSLQHTPSLDIQPILDKLDNLNRANSVDLQPLLEKLESLHSMGLIDLQPLLNKLDSFQPELKVDFAPLLEKLDALHLDLTNLPNNLSYTLSEYTSQRSDSSSESNLDFSELTRELSGQFGNLADKLDTIRLGLDNLSHSGVLENSTSDLIDQVSILSESVKLFKQDTGDHLAQISLILGELEKVTPALSQAASRLEESATLNQVNQAGLQAGVEGLRTSLGSIVGQLEHLSSKPKNEEAFLLQLQQSLEVFAQKSNLVLLENVTKTREILSDYVVRNLSSKVS